MKRILKTCDIFGTKAAVCINKYDTSVENAKEIEEFCEKNQIEFLGRIPYDPNVPKALNRGKSIAEVECAARTALYEIYKKTAKILAVT